MESSGSHVGIERVATEQVIEGEATRNVLEKQLIRWAKRGDTTPSVINIERLQFRNTAPVTVVAFDDGKPGQKIDLLGDGQTTVNHNSKIIRAGAAAGVLANGAVYTFTMWEDRVWHESQASGGGGGGGGGVTSFNGRAGAVVPVAGDYTPAFIGAVPSSHLTDPDPHTQYVLDSEKGAAGGVAQLDGSTLVPKAQLGTGVADATKYLRGDGTWQAPPGGGGSGTFVTFDEEVPPAAANARDDEFVGAGLNVKWTLVNWAGLAAYDVDTTCPDALFVDNTINAVTTRAILQAIPAGDFTIITSLEMQAKPTAYGYMGLILTDGTAAGAGNQLLHALVAENGSYTRWTQRGTNYGAFVTTANNDGAWVSNRALLRIRRVGTVYSTAYSINGLLWYENVSTIAWTPTHFGIGTQNNLAGGPLRALFKYFRYSASGTATFGGRILRTKV